ncbi:single- stranded DNA-binding family protein [Thermococcus sp.]|uniref:single- stranded DNA-binding family protein n=1 Tax=Thermococcus sp. TaxID=35749 RepID=UPI002601849F|nr:single- stranded DNA-binding family protein [Thermococcus sp.]
MRLSTGFVRASGYAYKVRRVLFAVTRGKVRPREVIRAAAELNQHIFKRLREMGVKKDDVIRVTVPFGIGDGRITWRSEGMKIEVYRREEEENLARAMEELEERERALDERIRELEELVVQLKTLSDRIMEHVELIKEEHTSLELRNEG